MPLSVRLMCVLALLLSLPLCAADAPDGTTFVHPVIAVDGPDLIRIRFCGVPLQVRMANVQLKEEQHDDAAKYLKEALKIGAPVRIELEPDLASDGPGAPAAHLFAGTTHINLEMVKRGIAASDSRSRKFSAAFQAAQVDAMTNKRGLWTKDSGTVAVKVPPPPPPPPDNSKKPDPGPTATAQKLPEIAPAGYKGMVVADLNGKEYHFPGSRFAQNIRAGAKIEYKTAEEAERAGKTPSPFSFPERAKEMADKVVAAKAGGASSPEKMIEEARKALGEARDFMFEANKNLKTNADVANDNWKKAAKLLSEHIDRITPLADANPRDQDLQKLAEEMSMRLYSCNKYQSLQ